MKITFSALAVFFTFFLFGLEQTKACSCSGKISPCAAYKEADLLFVGTVSKVTVVKDAEGFSNYNAKFSVESAIKGTRLKQIAVQTSTQGTACGYNFEQGQKYLVYAYFNEKTKKYETSICTRTRPIESEKVDDEIEILKSLAEGKF